MSPPNRLAHESSPYLLQHANNPVDWYPWGAEALDRARRENKPIFLSIGYAACHWCHVMERESFEDPDTAARMNDWFVNIKVDREERPDLDQIYMQAVVALTGHGGWPMSVWLTPDGVPFYGGTYFPSQPRHGMPAFNEVLAALADAWEKEPDRIREATARLHQVLQQEPLLARPADGVPGEDALDHATEILATGFDARNGGWGSAPKFPQAMAIEFLLRRAAAHRDERARRMVDTALTAMARGGIYDHLGGGFHRYATDAAWLVPHFEKMLYDNAQLARAYLHAWRLTANPASRRVVIETLDYVAREMTHRGGGFFSSQDADSEGEEGKFYVWSHDEIRELLGEAADPFGEVYGVTRAGNFEGRNILSLVRHPEEVARAHGMERKNLEALLARARQTLFVAREGRIKPARDEKVLTAWNGLMLAAFAEAARALGRQDYRDIALNNAEFLLREVRTSEGRLRRSWREGSGARLNGYLEDYTHLTEGLLALYEATFDARWFVAARDLAESVLKHFSAGDGLFFDTSDDHERLVTRPRDPQDNAVPSGNAMAVTVLLKLAAFTGESRYADAAERALQAVGPALVRYPVGFGQWLVAAAFRAGKPKEIALVGEPDGADTKALLEVAYAGFRPNQVVALERPGEASTIPLLQGRTALEGKATAFVCEGFTCKMPVTDAGELGRLLGE